LENSHVLPALLRKFHEAKERGATEVAVWGTGTPRREFMHVDDLANAAVYLMRRPTEHTLVNIGIGEDISIRELAEMIREIVGFKGGICFDATKPDGTPRKLLDVTRLHSLGWRAKIALREGIVATYRWYLENQL
jgi:GDP-L-fucose synthase